MKKTFFLVLLGLQIAFTTTLSAQTTANDNELHYSAVQVSFFPPLSTNGLYSSRYTNDFSLNLLVGISKNERIFTLAGLSNIILNDASGFQLAGLSNYTGGSANSFQLAGLTNIVMGNFKGLQLAGLFNTAADVNGLQFAGLFNTSANVNGLQYTGLFNVANNVHGVQFAGLFNVAKNVCGVQFSGLLNVANNVHGVQFSGLVNIADHSDYPIGLVNIIKDGEMGIAVGYNETGTISATFRSGGKVLYGVLGLGFNHHVKESKNALSVIGGYGAHINILSWLRINNELTMESFNAFSSEENSTFKTGYALLPALRFGHFEIFGGPNINFMQTDDTSMYNLFPERSLWEKEYASGRLQKVSIGWQVGMQFIF